MEQVPVSLRQRIEPILDDFERKLRKSGDVRIEDFLDASSEDDSSYLFKQLLVVEVDYKLAHGKQPIPGSYVGRFPHFANDVHSVFDDLHGKLVEANSEPTIVYRTHPAKRERIGDNYRVIKQVGRGAFADVFHCLNERIDRECAVKVPRHDRNFTACQLQQFADEAKSLARCKHSGIVQVYHVAIIDDVPCIEAEFIDGETLDEKLGREMLGFRQAAELTIEIAKALASAHEQQIYHRDLKPANILIDKSGKPYVADFGLALKRDDQSDRKGEQAGTPTYMAPEQHRGESESIDGRSDIWSLGVILYKILTGETPFRGMTQSDLASEIENRPLTPPRQLNNEIPATFDAICERCLAKNPHDRYAIDLADDLQQWLSATIPATAPATAPTDIRRRTVVALSSCFAIFLAALMWIAFGASNDPNSQEADLQPKPDAKPEAHTRLPVLQDPYEIDEWAFPGRWESLLHVKPRPLIRSEEIINLEHHQSELEMFSVDVADVGAWSTGKTKSSTFGFKVTLSRTRWTGRCGIIWGYSQLSDKKASFCAIELVSKEEGFFIHHSVYQLKLNNTSRPSIDGPYPVWMPIPIAPPKLTEHELEIQVADGKLIDLIWDKSSLKFRKPSGATPPFTPDGEFGLFSIDGSAIFQRAQFRAQ